MEQTKLAHAAMIIKDSAIEYLAKFHGVTRDTVLEAIRSDSPNKAQTQFAELVTAGIEEAMRLRDSGAINI